MSEWNEAWDRSVAMIERHPLFNKVIREVAAAEYCIPARGYSWLRRNSYTYGTWMTRQADGGGGQAIYDAMARNSRRRANILCDKIAAELFPDKYQDFPGDQRAKVYVTARYFAAAREFFHG